MDFHSLARRDLQALCKKNRIPANMTNAAMADALHALHAVGGFEGIQEEASPYRSPMKAEAGSPDLPRTSRRTSARRAAPPASVELKEQPASPLPRARRVTAKASAIRRLAARGEEDEENEKKDGSPEAVLMTPVVARSVPKPKGNTATKRSTRSRASKKEDAEDEEGLVEAAKSPGTRNGRRRMIMADEEAKEEAAVWSRTGQSSKSTMAVDVTTSAVRRSARVRTRAAVREMEALAQEEVGVKRVEEGIETKNSLERNDDSLPLSEDNISDLAAGNVSDLKETEEIQDQTVHDKDGEQDCDVVAEENTVLPQHHLAMDVKERGLVPETEGFDNASETETSSQQVEEVTRVVETEEKPSDLAADVGLQEKIEEEADGTQDNISCSGINERDCNVVVDNTNLLQHQLAKQDGDGMVQEAEGISGERVQEEESGRGGELLNKAVNVLLSGPGGSPVVGLIYSLENLEITGDGVNEQSEKEMEEMRLDWFLGGDIPNGSKNSGILDQAREFETSAVPTTGFPSEVPATPAVDASAEIKGNAKESGDGNETPEKAVTNLEVAASSPLQQIPLQSPSLQSSNTVELPAGMLAKAGDGTGDSEGSPAEVVDVIDGPADARNTIGSPMTAGIIFEGEKSKNKSQYCDAGKENKNLAQLTMTEGCREVKMETEAEKQGLDVDLSGLSSRNLKMYKEKTGDIDNKVEGRRLALAELNENIL